MPVIITELSSLEIAVESMRIGAHDFIVKPVNIDELRKNIGNIMLEREDLKKGKEKLPDILKIVQASDSDDMVVVVASQETANPSFLSRLGFLKPIITLFKLFKKYFWDID